LYEPNLCAYRKDMASPQGLSYIYEKKSGPFPLIDHLKDGITAKNKIEDRTHKSSQFY